MELYDCQMAPNPRRARIFIAEKHLDIKTNEISIIEGENLKEDYLKINPWGLLPSLVVDENTVISEVPSIFLYLELFDLFIPRGYLPFIWMCHVPPNMVAFSYVFPISETLFDINQHFSTLFNII